MFPNKPVIFKNPTHALINTFIIKKQSHAFLELLEKRGLLIDTERWHMYVEYYTEASNEYLEFCNSVNKTFKPQLRKIPLQIFAIPIKCQADDVVEMTKLVPDCVVALFDGLFIDRQTTNIPEFGDTYTYSLEPASKYKLVETYHSEGADNDFLASTKHD